MQCIFTAWVGSSEGKAHLSAQHTRWREIYRRLGRLARRAETVTGTESEGGGHDIEQVLAPERNLGRGEADRNIGDCNTQVDVVRLGRAVIVRLRRCHTARYRGHMQGRRRIEIRRFGPVNVQPQLESVIEKRLG